MTVKDVDWLQSTGWAQQKQEPKPEARRWSRTEQQSTQKQHSWAWKGRLHQRERQPKEEAVGIWVKQLWQDSVWSTGPCGISGLGGARSALPEEGCGASSRHSLRGVWRGGPEPTESSATHSGQACLVTRRRPAKPQRQSVRENLRRGPGVYSCVCESLQTRGIWFFILR